MIDADEVRKLIDDCDVFRERLRELESGKRPWDYGSNGPYIRQGLQNLTDDANRLGAVESPPRPTVRTHFTAGAGESAGWNYFALLRADFFKSDGSVPIAIGYVEQLREWATAIYKREADFKQAAAALGHSDAEKGEQPAEPTAAESNKQPSIEDQMLKVAQVVGDDNAARILAITQRKDLTGEEKYIEILRLDRRFEGKLSGEIGTLLNVSDAAVRGWQTWKLIQARKKSLD